MNPNSSVRSVEIQFAQKLASNEPKNRDKALKKLKKWLMHRTSINVDEMLRITKGLHYCFWMSDKPLVQEDLAQNISNLVHVFQTLPTSLTFIQCFLITMGREWSALDGIRLNKFMLLIRRVLREMLCLGRNNNWDHKLCLDLSSMIGRYAVNSRNDDSALGFQMHFVDIFMEELAKEGGKNLDADTVYRFLQPFIDELAYGKDDRMIKHIEQRIFFHLFRQSDVGIIYQDTGCSEIDMDALRQHISENTENIDFNSNEIDDGISTIKDPRAGKVDVVLPQISSVDYNVLGATIFNMGAKAGLKANRRRALYRLSKKCYLIAKGTFPLAIELRDNKSSPKLPKLKKLIQTQTRVDEETKLNHRRERINFQKFMKRKITENKAVTATNDNGDGDNKQTAFMNVDSNSLFNQGKSQCLDEEVPNKVRKLKQKTSKRKKSGKLGNSHSDVEISKISYIENSVQNKTNAIKLGQATNIQDNLRRKNKRIRSKTTDFDKEHLPTSIQRCEKKPFSGKKRKNVSDNVDEVSDKKPMVIDNVIINGDLTELKQDLHIHTDEIASDSNAKNEKVFKKCKIKRQVVTNIFVESNDWLNNTESSNSCGTAPYIKSVITSSALKTKKKIKKKRISIALTENKYQEHLAHSESVRHSPSIPFDASKTPKQGILKVKSGAVDSVITPPSRQAVAQNTLINGKSPTMNILIKKRCTAADFF